MLTIHSVDAAAPLVVGRLIAHRRGRVRGRPALACRWWCAYCRVEHEVDWPDPPFPLEVAVRSPAPCPAGAFAALEVVIGLDRSRAGELRHLIEAQSQSLRRWRVEQRLRNQFAEEWAADRAYRREGWDVVPSP